MSCSSVIIIIIIIKNEKIRVTLCENAAGALYIVNSYSVLIYRYFIIIHHEMIEAKILLHKFTVPSVCICSLSLSIHCTCRPTCNLYVYIDLLVLG